MVSVSYVLMIMMPFYGNYQVIGAETYLSFRKCMVEAQDYNYKTKRKTFAVCMPIAKDED
jgi:hypothetical protein